MSTEIEGVPTDVAKLLETHLSILLRQDKKMLLMQYGSAPGLHLEKAIAKAGSAMRCYYTRSDGFEETAVLAAAELLAAVAKSRQP